MFGLSQAFTTTGVRFTYTLNPVVTTSIGLINGWDNIEDNNRGKSFEWLVALTPHERFGATFYGSYGPEQTNGNGGGAGSAIVQGCSSVPGPNGTGGNANAGCDPTAKRTVVGAILTAKVTDSDTIILEPYYGNESNAQNNTSSHNGRWNGLGAYHIHDFNDHGAPGFVERSGRMQAVPVPAQGPIILAATQILVLVQLRKASVLPMH